MSAYGRFIWRVKAGDGEGHATAFDAVVLRFDEHGRVPNETLAHVDGASVPYEEALVDTPLTLIVRSRETSSPLIVECEALSSDGERRVYARATRPVAIIVRSVSGVLVTGLPTREL